MGLELFTEQLHTAYNRSSRGITQWAERFPTQIITDIYQQIDVLLLSLPMFQAMQNLRQPVCSLAAGRTFAARFVAIKLRHTQHRAHDTGILTDNNYPTRT